MLGQRFLSSGSCCTHSCLACRLWKLLHTLVFGMPALEDFVRMWKSHDTAPVLLVPLRVSPHLQLCWFIMAGSLKCGV